MLQKKVYFKSDFKVFLESEAGWTGLPFRLKFYTGAPTRAFVACFDGTEYHNCHLHEDGRLCVAFDNHNFGFGTLRMEPTFYLNDACYRDGICDEAIPPFDVVLKDAPTEEVPEPEEYTIVLAMDGVKTLETIGTLPAFYQKGDNGDPGLTPEEHDALIQATSDANAAADRANGVIDDADAAARLATAAAVNADNKAAAAAEAARLADAARQQLTTTFNKKVAALESDYDQKKQALDADYESVKQSLGTDYANTKIALEADYTQKKAALDADYASAKSALSTAYAEAIASLNNRMSAIETQYATDKVEWQRQVDAILAKFEQDFATAEAAREERVALAIAHADTAAGNANAAATQASNVNAVLDGDELTVTDRNGQSVTRNVRGPQGEPGASVTFFPAVTIFGQPRIQETQMSEFSAANYAQFPFLVDFAGRHWQLDCAITTGADVRQQHNVFDSAFGLAFAFSGGKFVLAMSSNGTSWNMGATSGTHSILANTTYYIRITWDGANYVLAYSTDKVNWTNDITVASTESLASKQIIIGKSLDNAHIFNGSINFAEARLTIAGVIVWEGMEEVGTATRMAIDMSNIDEAGKQRLNEVAMDGKIGKLLSRLIKTIGPYSDRAPITLTAVENNVAINRAGVKVAKTGWAIASFSAEKGNEYLFNPGTMDGDVCIFSEEIIKQEVRSISYTYTYNEAGLPVSATATYNGVIHSYSFAYEYDEEGRVVSETITDNQTGATINALPYQYRTTVGTYQPLTVLNASAELPMDDYCRFISHFQGNGTIKVVVSFHLATADKQMLVFRDGFTANLATQLGTLSQKIDEADKVIAILEQALATAEAELAQIITDKADDSAMPTICGQPMKLYGAGTPQEAIVPTNWRQFDPETGEGYNWNGIPSAYGQEYIDTTNGAKYEAVADGYYNLKWLRV